MLQAIHRFIEECWWRYGEMMKQANAQLEMANTLRSRGTHVVIDAAILPGDEAVGRLREAIWQLQRFENHMVLFQQKLDEGAKLLENLTTTPDSGNVNPGNVG